MSTATTKKKWVEKEVLEDFSLPEEHQMILKIVKSTGNNLHKVVTESGEEFLASMPLKFRKHIWIKRGDYVVGERIPEGNKVKAEIVRILRQDQIKHFIEYNAWPEGFNFEVKKKKLDSYEIDEDLLPKSSDSDDEDGSDVEADKFVRCNPNKYLLPHILDNSPCDSEESDDEDYDGDDKSNNGSSGESSDEDSADSIDEDDSHSSDNDDSNCNKNSDSEVR